jgi:P-type Cu+ transporter
VPFVPVTDFLATPGGGVEGKILGKTVLAGTAKFLRDHEIALPEGRKMGVLTAQPSAITSVYVAIGGHAAGAILLRDRVKPYAAGAVEALKQSGLRIVMLTGDRQASAKMVADKLGITEVQAEVLPQEKGELVRGLREPGRVVAMAGDGINDAPALAAADVGIAMGTGTDVAIENAGIILLKGDLRGIVRARKLSRATIRNIKQNLAFAFVYNAIGIPIAAGVFYPLFGWLLSPMLASAAMSFSSVSVIANALRLRKFSL